jgi:hypothetical protein
MEKKLSVIKSIHNNNQTQCIDIFLQHNGNFAFQEFRRDIEDPIQWFQVSSLTETTYSDISQLENYLRKHFNWLDIEA